MLNKLWRIIVAAMMMAMALVAAPANLPVVSAHSADCSGSDFMEIKVWSDANYSGTRDYNCLKGSDKVLAFQWDGDPNTHNNDMSWHDIGDTNNMHDNISSASIYLYGGAGDCCGPSTYCIQFFSDEGYAGTKWFTVVMTIPNSSYTKHIDIPNFAAIEFFSNDSVDSIRVNHKNYFPNCDTSGLIIKA